MKVFVALLVVVSSVAAQYGGGYGGHQSYGGQASYGGHQSYGHEEKDYYVEPHYSFAYEVHDSHTGDIKSHKEERKGEHTQGVYYLVEPDGSKRTVEYIVEGKSGFNAKVLREGSKHPSGGYKSGGYSSGGYSNEGYKSGGYSSGGYGGASSSSSFSTHGSLGGSYSQPSYKPSYQQSYEPSYKPSYQQSYEPSYKPSYQQSYEPSYKPSYNEPSYKPSYGGQATSSVSIATHGAKIATQTYHAAPSKHY
ncbi:hypothetical protein GE061_014184 [Apolygus lucorum]|uniref:Uncharacterized protein n=1 Tax=Apolygus lucorum TaxID=248454 RepID=A0A8S9XRY6_APOLU|nr:hypothetical protein GE061_014184 [Apolygus lucorum]